MTTTGYLQHGAGTSGPYRTESVRVRHNYADNYEAHFEGRWRKVYLTDPRDYIVYQGNKITIKIEGV